MPHSGPGVQRASKISGGIRRVRWEWEMSDNVELSDQKMNHAGAVLYMGRITSLA